MRNFLTRANYKQIIAIVIFVFLAMLMLDLNSRITEFVQVSKQRDKIQTEVLQLRRTREVLLTEVAFVTSEAAVDDWASENYMGRPGDVRVVPLPPPNATPPAPVVAVATPRTVQNWEVWYALFLGE